jgi:hypothetical protein
MKADGARRWIIPRGRRAWRTSGAEVPIACLAELC